MRKPSYPFGLPDSLPFLFNGGEEGAIYDATVLSSLFQDAGGTTPVTTAAQPVGLVNDITSNNNDASQSTSGSRPTWNAVSGVNSLVFDKTDDYLTLGVQEVGTGLFADATAEPNGFCVALTFNCTSSYTSSATFVAKASATAANRTFQVFSFEEELYFYARGTANNAVAPIADGSWHGLIVNWDGSSLTYMLDSFTPSSLTVGTAAEEAENILIGARTSSLPAAFMSGGISNLMILSRSASLLERNLIMRYLAGKTGFSL